MLSRAARRSVLRCFHAPIAESTLSCLRGSYRTNRFELLRWMDDAGVSVYLADRLQRLSKLNELGPGFVIDLQDRIAANRLRVEGLLMEFEMVISALRNAGCECAVSKGFSVVPEFCHDIFLRHHSDIDLLVHPSVVTRATQVLSELGYRCEIPLVQGEIIFDGKGPKVSDDLMRSYELRCHSKIELHVSDRLPSMQSKTAGVVTFRALSTFELVRAHLLHAYKHLCEGWMRPSWLVEISNFIEQNGVDDPIWGKLHSDFTPQQRRRAALIFKLIEDQIGTPTPPAFRTEWDNDIVSWAEICGSAFVLADCEGTQLNLLLKSSFGDEVGGLRGPRVFPVHKLRRFFQLPEIRKSGFIRSIPYLYRKFTYFALKGAEYCVFRLRLNVERRRRSAFSAF